MNSRFYLGWDHIRRAWSGILGSDDLNSLPKVAADLPPSDVERVKHLMEDCLAARGGEVTARQRAAILGELYLTLNETGRRNFLETLVDNFYVDREQVKSRRDNSSKRQMTKAFNRQPAACVRL